MDNATFFGGVAVGAAVAMTFGRSSGAGRQRVLRDRLSGVARHRGHWLTAAVRDAASRVRAAAPVVDDVYDEEIDTDRLVARVRSKLGRACTHPGAIHVQVQDGRVVLSGPVLAREVDHILNAVGAVRGVRTIQNNLDARDTADAVAALQGDAQSAGAQRALPGLSSPAVLVGLAALTAGGMALACASRE